MNTLPVCWSHSRPAHTRRYKNMWQRINDEDLRKEKLEKLGKKEKMFFEFSPTELITSLLIAIFCAISASFSVKLTLSESIFCFIIIFSLSLLSVAHPFILSLLTMFLSEGRSSGRPDLTDICNTCYSVVPRSKLKNCECGGKYEPLENWKWEEDEIEESKQTN